MRFIRYSAVKLFGFGGTGKRCRGRIAAGNDLGDFVEIAGADEALMRHGAITQFLRGKLFLLRWMRRTCDGLLRR
jgi:hypothetical protein